MDELVQLVVQSGLKHVVLTGGEPMLPKQVTDLSSQLGQQGFHLTIETAGTVDRDVHCDLMSISPKFRSSGPEAAKHPRWNRDHESRRKSIESTQRLVGRSADYQLKFVVDSEDDFEELTEIVDAVGAAGKDVWVMPQGSTIEALDAAKQWLEPWTREQGFEYCDRMQIRWYGNRRGT